MELTSNPDEMAVKIRNRIPNFFRNKQKTFRRKVRLAKNGSSEGYGSFNEN